MGEGREGEPMAGFLWNPTTPIMGMYVIYRGKAQPAHMSKFRSLFELDEASSLKVNSITTLCFLSGL